MRRPARSCSSRSMTPRNRCNRVARSVARMGSTGRAASKSTPSSGLRRSRWCACGPVSRRRTSAASRPRTTAAFAASKSCGRASSRVVSPQTRTSPISGCSRSRSPDEIEEEIDMKKGVITTLVVVLLAVAAAAGVFLFMNGVRDRAEADRVTVDVIVASQDVPAGQELDPLIDDGVFRPKAVDRVDLLSGVITDVYQLRGQRTAYPILAGEQIAGARLAGPLQAAGGALGIPDGLQAASITLQPQRVVAGAIKQGDRVEVF